VNHPLFRSIDYKLSNGAKDDLFEASNTCKAANTNTCITPVEALRQKDVTSGFKRAMAWTENESHSLPHQ